jgi:hypothetical protein
MVRDGFRACFENISGGLAAGRGGWLRCASVADFSRISALVAPRQPPRRARNPGSELFSKHALGPPSIGNGGILGQGARGERRGAAPRSLDTRNSAHGSAGCRALRIAPRSCLDGVLSWANYISMLHILSREKMARGARARGGFEAGLRGKRRGAALESEVRNPWELRNARPKGGRPANTSRANFPNSNAKRPCGSAHGSFIVLTRYAGQSQRGVRARPRHRPGRSRSGWL